MLLYLALLLGGYLTISFRLWCRTIHGNVRLLKRLRKSNDPPQPQRGNIIWKNVNAEYGLIVVTVRSAIVVADGATVVSHTCKRCTLKGSRKCPAITRKF